MKKILLLLLIALMIGGSALADSRAAEMNGQLYLSVNGLHRLQDGGAQLMAEGDIRSLQAANGALYYVLREEIDYDLAYETLYSMDADGNARILGEKRSSGLDYPAGYFAAYGDMTVYDGHIYFISSVERPGSYSYRFIFEDYAHDGSVISEQRDHSAEYTLVSSLFRMDLDGGNLVELIPNLGNGPAYFDIANGTIAVAASWYNAYHAYHFYDFRLYNLSGELLRELPNEAEDRHSWFYKEDCEFTEIVQGISTDGEAIYASLSDSEGDFASSRLTNMAHADQTLIYEANFTPSVPIDDGFISFTSDAEDEFWSENMASSLRLQRGFGSEAIVLARIPHEFSFYGSVNLCLLGDMVYFSNDTRMIRVPASGGTVEEWTGSGFAPAPEFSPA